MVVVVLQMAEDDQEPTTEPDDEANAPAETEAAAVAMEDRTGVDAEAARVDVAAARLDAAASRSCTSLTLASPCRPGDVRQSGQDSPA
jgi:hypothetical protein